MNLFEPPEHPSILPRWNKPWQMHSSTPSSPFHLAGHSKETSGKKSSDIAEKVSGTTESEEVSDNTEWKGISGNTELERVSGNTELEGISTNTELGGISSNMESEDAFGNTEVEEWVEISGNTENQDSTNEKEVRFQDAGVMRAVYK